MSEKLLNIKNVYVKDEGDGLCSNSDDMLLSKINVLEDFLKKNMSYISSQIPKERLSKYLKNTYKWTGYHLAIHGNNKLARSLYKKSLNAVFDIKTMFYYLKSFLPPAFSRTKDI